MRQVGFETVTHIARLAEPVVHRHAVRTIIDFGHLPLAPRSAPGYLVAIDPQLV